MSEVEEISRLLSDSAMLGFVRSATLTEGDRVHLAASRQQWLNDPRWLAYAGTQKDGGKAWMEGR